MLLFNSNLDQFYKADRGAHNYFLEKGVVDSRPDHILNLIHYEVRVPFHLQLFLYLLSLFFLLLLFNIIELSKYNFSQPSFLISSGNQSQQETDYIHFVVYIYLNHKTEHDTCRLLNWVKLSVNENNYDAERQTCVWKSL